MPRLARVACAMFALLLTGCYVADDDDRNPIIPAASMAYPLQTGIMYECGELAIKCNKVDITRQTWGYQVRVLERGESVNGLEGVTNFKMRALQFEGGPPNIFLVQLVAADPAERKLALVGGKGDGDWVIFRPRCGSVSNHPFLKDLGRGNCAIRRAGLTDQRLFVLLMESYQTTSLRLPK